MYTLHADESGLVFEENDSRISYARSFKFYHVQNE